jgi:hypothetical protein
MLQDGYNEPTWFDGIDTLAPIHRIGVFGLVGNPNTKIQVSTSNLSGNVGGFDEIYNSGLNELVKDSVVFKNANGDVLAGIDYCNTTKFTAVMTSNNLSAANSTFNIGIMWRPIDAEVYQNLNTNFGQNTMVLAPTNSFVDAVTPDVTVYNGNAYPPNNAMWSFQNLQFTISGTTLTIVGDIIPNGSNTTHFSALSEGEKKTTFWVSHTRIDKTPSQRKKASVLLYDEDVICSPILGVAFVPESYMFTDAGNIDITDVTTVTTTEDSVLYGLTFKLQNDVVYEGLRTNISAYNSTTGEEFILEEVYVDFGSQPLINGIHQIEETINRGFLLPPDSDKNVISLKRFTSIDDISSYGLQLKHAFLVRWQYWIEQSDVSNDFFSLTEQFNGLNNNWFTFSNNADWQLRMSTYLKKDGINDFYNSNFNIRDYNDEDVTVSTIYTNLADGSNPTVLIANSLIEIEITATWNTGVFGSNIWAEMTIESKEGERIGIISSLLEQGSVSSNVLKPIDTNTKLDFNVVSNVATLKAVIDTGLINATVCTITHRLFSSDSILNGKLTEDGLQKLTEIGTNKIKD